MKSILPAVAVVLVMGSFFHAAPTEPTTNSGKLRFAVLTDRAWDRYTSAPPNGMRRWFADNIWRMMVYSTYWDSRLAWYPNAWAYINLYALYVGSDVAAGHRDWILKDKAGNSLYIPWGCHDGTCPQFAADLSNANFRAYWIGQARDLKHKGYRGLFIDDVNQEFRIGDRYSKQSAPFRAQEQREVSWEDWRRSVAEFTEQIRRSIPDLELVHNAIWYAGGPNRDRDAFVKRQIAAADYINLERGVNDGGLRGGSGEWSLRELFAYIDRVHALGPGVLIDYMGGDIEYTAACYLLVNSGKDAIGDQAMKPDQWWPGAQVNLGAARGNREEWQGLIRRRFAGGVALVNPPDAAPVKLVISGSMKRASGDSARPSITLAAAHGIILQGSPDLVRVAE